MTNEQKVQLLKGMVKAGELLKKCANMLEAETNERKYLFDGSSMSNVTYERALENMLEELDRELAETSGVYGDNTTPNYDIPTDVFVVGREYNAWLDYYYGEYSSYLTLIGRKDDVLYLKYKNDIIRANVRIQKTDKKDVEIAFVEWQGKDGNYYKTDIAANDYDD